MSPPLSQPNSNNSISNANSNSVAHILSSTVSEALKSPVGSNKVLEKDDANVSVLGQRALLYESMEKYKLGAEDLRTVLRIDPGNRVARGTIHRLTQLAD